MKKPKKLAIIDGKSVFYRGYYAMPNLSTKDGTPTGGVYGFAAMALEVLKKLQPDYVCVAWDKPKTNIRRRRELYPEYKAGRKPAPADFYVQIPLLHELLEAFGWPLYEFDDYEADDIMGTLALQASQKGIETQLVTSDLDMLQLVNPLIHVFALKKGLSNIELFSPELFEEKYGIRADQFLDLKALMGDSSDNIPGVPGIGKKTAVQLLSEHETLEGVYDNLGLIKDSVRRKLEAGKESALLSKKIAAIWTDAPVTLDLKKLDVAHCDPEAVRDALQKFEFRSLLRQLPEVMRVAVGEEMANIQSAGLAPVDLTSIAAPADLNLLQNAKVLYVLAHYSDSRKTVVEQIALVADDSTKGVLLTGKALQNKRLQQAVCEVLASASLVVSHDAKAILRLCYQWQGESFTVASLFDVHIAAFLLNALLRDQSLAALAREHLDLEIEAEATTSRQALATQVAVLQKLHSLFSRDFAKDENKKLVSLFTTIEMPIIPVLASMEHKGIKLDTQYLQAMSDELADQISDVEQQIYGHANQEFNIASPSQLADVLFHKMQLPTQGIKKGKSAYSTAASELAKLRSVHPIIDLISHYREYVKLKSTYVDTLPTMVDEHSRLHTTFNLTIAQTGRLSSTDPNLQNIPVRTELGKRIRTAFVAQDGHVLVSADYSQFELRLAACLAEDEELVDMFNRDVDIHTATAAQVYERQPEDVTKNMRRDAKVINFGILYGMSPHGLSIATGMSFTAAKAFIDKYFQLRKPILAYLESLKTKAREDGFVETLFGRRRPMPDIHSSNFAVRQAAERAAMNMPIQGTEADLMKMAMIAVEKKLSTFADTHQLLQIHDSIMVECPEEQAKEVAKMLKATMENIYPLSVKLTVDTSIGKNWGEL